MFKVQIACVFLLCFLLLLLLSERDFGRKTRKLFAVMVLLSIAQSFFDMASIYVVLHMDVVSPLVYKTVHRTYLTLVLTFFYVLYVYKTRYVEEETGISTKSWAFINISQIILYGGIFALPLGYLESASGKYVYGPGVWVVYVGAAYYMFLVLGAYVEYAGKISREKIVPLFLGIVSGAIVCFYYMSNPDSAISGLGILLINLGNYISLCKSKTMPLGKSCAFKKDLSDYEVVFQAPDAKVLVVDDSMINRKVVANLLEKTQMQIDEACGGKECLEMVKANSYDLIFMDHLMPEMDGLETVAILRGEHMCDRTPIVAMTANAENMTEDDYIARGFTALLSKPIAPQKLLHISYRLLKGNLITECEFLEKKAAETAMQTGEHENMVAANDTAWTEDLPLIDGIDYQYTALHFADALSFADMVRFLVSVMPHDAEELSGYYDAIDTEQGRIDFRTKVHSMKNSAMTVGIVPLAGLAKTLEDAANERNRDTVHALMPVFLARWEVYRLRLKEKLVEDGGEKTEADPFSEEIKVLFRKLKCAAEEMDIDEMDGIMSQLDGYSFPEEYDEEMTRIRLAVMNFEVEYLQDGGLSRFIGE